MADLANPPASAHPRMMLVESQTTLNMAATWSLERAEMVASSPDQPRVMWMMELPRDEAVQVRLTTLTAALQANTPLLPLWSCRPTEALVGKAAARHTEGIDTYLRNVLAVPPDYAPRTIILVDPFTLLDTNPTVWLERLTTWHQLAPETVFVLVQPKPGLTDLTRRRCLETLRAAVDGCFEVIQTSTPPHLYLQPLTRRSDSEAEALRHAELLLGDSFSQTDVPGVTLH